MRYWRSPRQRKRRPLPPVGKIEKAPVKPPENGNPRAASTGNPRVRCGQGRVVQCFTTLPYCGPPERAESHGT